MLLSVKRRAWVLMLFLWTPVLSQNQPEHQNYSLNSGSIGALQNSVNLLTGQASFPMNLVSLPNRSGLNIDVSILYNSAGSDRLMAMENSDATTGTLGLGWSLNVPEIVCDHNNTGTREDDTFYLIEGGVSYRLVCTGGDPYQRKYSTDKFNLWEITFYTSQEKWVIRKENGYRYTFGDKNSSANAVKWAVKWGNWIGASSNTSGQSQMGYSWSLSKIENLWQDYVDFTYESTTEPVGVNGAEHTKALYISSIADAAGQQVNFIYGDKDSYEYEDMHVEQAEPDAYQEKFETKYLSRIEVSGENSQPLYDVALEYELHDSDNRPDIRKRYLTGVKKIFPDGSEQPPMQFNWFHEGEYAGYLKSVGNSLGARISYFYEKDAVPSSDRDILITPPANFGNPEVYQHQDYAVIMWYENGKDKGYGDVKVSAFRWNGGWVQEDVEEFDVYSNVHYKYNITLQNNFFAIVRKRMNTNSEPNVYIYRKSPASPDKWMRYRAGGRDTFVDTYTPPALLSGDHFVALGLTDPTGAGNLFTLTWNGTGYEIEQHPFEISLKEYFHYTASGNWIIRHATAYGDYIDLFHLTQDRRWLKNEVYASGLFNTHPHNPSFWYGNPSFAVAMAAEHPEYIYMWDESYSNINRVEGFNALHDFSKVNITQNSLVGIVDTSMNGRVQSARYDGQTWHFTPSLQTSRVGAHGNDMFLHNEYLDGTYWFKGDYARRLSLFDPNNLTWNIAVKSWQKNNTYADQTAFQASGQYYLVENRLYRINKYGNNEYVCDIPLESDETLAEKTVIAIAPGFAACEYIKGDQGQLSGVYLVHIKNSVAVETIKLEGTLRGKESFAGPASIALFKPSGQIQLHRIMDQKISGPVEVVRVKNFIWTDGHQPFETSFHYENGRAVPNGAIAMYNKVAVVQGSDDPAAFPNGKTEYFFHNGMKEAHLLESPAEITPGYARLLTSLPYRTKIINSDAEVVSETVNHYTVYDTVVSSYYQAVEKLYYVRNTRVETTTDGITQTVERTFDPLTGLVKSETQYNSAADSVYDVHTVEYTRWNETYAGAADHLYTPVVQSVHYRNGEPIGSAVTTWKSWGSLPAPEVTYQWTGTGTPDFPWSDPSQVSADQWRLVSQIRERDAQTGAVLSASGADGTVSGTIYNDSRTRVIAEVDYAGPENAAYSGFEEGAAGNWNYPPEAVSTYAFLGERSFGGLTSAQQISRSNLPAGRYRLQYWWKLQQPDISVSDGEVLSGTTKTVEAGWKLTQQVLQLNSTGSVSLNVVPGAKVDELRLLPEEAEMITSGYDSHGLLKFSTDANMISSFYEYDSQYRMLTARDQDGNIVKTYSYHFRNQ